MKLQTVSAPVPFKSHISNYLIWIFRKYMGGFTIITGIRNKIDSTTDDSNPPGQPVT